MSLGAVMKSYSEEKQGINLVSEPEEIREDKEKFGV
jgi:hypothetical protein